MHTRRSWIHLSFTFFSFSLREKARPRRVLRSLPLVGSGAPVRGAPWPGARSCCGALDLALVVVAALHILDPPMGMIVGRCCLTWQLSRMRTSSSTHHHTLPLRNC